MNDAIAVDSAAVVGAADSGSSDMKNALILVDDSDQCHRPFQSKECLARLIENCSQSI